MKHLHYRTFTSRANQNKVMLPVTSALPRAYQHKTNFSESSFPKFTLCGEDQFAYLSQRSPRHCHKLIISPYRTQLSTLPLRVCLTVLVAVMWAFLQSDQTIRDVLPAYGALHHQHVLIWSYALQKRKRGLCACLCSV